jgi:hypothetical protein
MSVIVVGPLKGQQRCTCTAHGRCCAHLRVLLANQSACAQPCSLHAPCIRWGWPGAVAVAAGEAPGGEVVAVAAGRRPAQEAVYRHWRSPRLQYTPRTSQTRQAKHERACMAASKLGKSGEVGGQHGKRSGGSLSRWRVAGVSSCHSGRCTGLAVSPGLNALLIL